MTRNIKHKYPSEYFIFLSDTGVNFAHFPSGSHLVVVDPNPHFQAYFDANKSKFTGIRPEKFIITTGLCCCFCLIIITSKMILSFSFSPSIDTSLFLFYMHVTLLLIRLYFIVPKYTYNWPKIKKTDLFSIQIISNYTFRSYYF